MSETLAMVVGDLLRWLPPIVLLWLAVFFGRTLRRGATPLIERIARQGHPALPAPLQRYTRGLTAVWSAYFAGAAMLTAFASEGSGRASLLVWAGTVVLFVGERLLRPWFFPGQAFPGLMQQLRDTWSVWRVRG